MKKGTTFRWKFTCPVALMLFFGSLIALVAARLWDDLGALTLLAELCFWVSMLRLCFLWGKRKSGGALSQKLLHSVLFLVCSFALYQMLRSFAAVQLLSAACALTLGFVQQPDAQKQKHATEIVVFIFCAALLALILFPLIALGLVSGAGQR